MKPIEYQKYEVYFDKARDELSKFQFEYSLEYISYEKIADVQLEIAPKFFDSTESIVKKVETIYHELILALRLSSSEKNMAYYVRYYLDRFIPDELVKGDKKL